MTRLCNYRIVAPAAVLLLAWGPTAASAATPAAASTRAPAVAASPFVLAIGVNTPNTGDLASLQFADDDAIEAVRLLALGPQAPGAPTGALHRARLLATLDAATERERPGWGAYARPPTREELTRAVTELVAGVEQARAAGELPHVHVWLSGHAAYDDDGHARFPLHGGGISASAFLRDVVEPLAAAHRVHLYIDTCFAEALVKARAQVKSVEPALAQSAFSSQRLEALPNVGAFVAASSKSAAYEWGELRSGVFSALIRAGLRGAADADRDDVVRYSELAAFLAAATDAIAVEQARPDLVVHRPRVESNAALVSRRPGAHTGEVVLDTELASYGPFSIVDERGVFLVAGALEADFQPRLWLPRDRPLFLRAKGAEHPLREVEGELQIAEGQPLDVAARSLVSRALAEGLFQTPFGPGFYRGFRVTSAQQSAAATVVPAATERSFVGETVVFSAAGVSAVAFAGAGAVTALLVAAWLTAETERASYERFAALGVGAGLTAGLLVAALGFAGTGAALLVLE